MKALRQITYAQPLEVHDVPIPEVTVGSAVVKILGANIVSYTKDVYNGVRKYPYPTPLTVGASAIGRVHAVGPDAISLNPDQLVLIDMFIRGRDDPTTLFLSAVHEGYTPGSKKLMQYWRDGVFAEYVRFPLENVFPLNEDSLIKTLGYTVEDLLIIPRLLVPWGGIVDIDLHPSETVVIAPATGPFGSAAVHCALAVGARVIAMGRNTETLSRLSSTFSSRFPPSRLTTIPISGSVETDLAAIKKAAGTAPVDAFFDISPPVAVNSSHFKAAILALRHYGRVSLMGGQREDVLIPHVKVMHYNLVLKGKWMYERADILSMLRMVESGNLLLGEKAGFGTPKKYSLEQWAEAFEEAASSDALTIGPILVPAGENVELRA